jgi:hypothetical protein
MMYVPSRSGDGCSANINRVIRQLLARGDPERRQLYKFAVGIYAPE